MEIAPTFPIFPAKVQSLTKLMPHFTTADLERLGYVQQSNGSYRQPNHEPKSQATHQPCAARLPDTKCKQVRPKTLERVSQAQDRSQNSTPCSNAGRRSHVTIVRHSSRLLDPDNLVASVKPLTIQPQSSSQSYNHNAGEGMSEPSWRSKAVSRQNAKSEP